MWAMTLRTGIGYATATCPQCREDLALRITRDFDFAGPTCEIEVDDPEHPCDLEYEELEAAWAQYVRDVSPGRSTR